MNVEAASLVDLAPVINRGIDHFALSLRTPSLGRIERATASDLVRVQELEKGQEGRMSVVWDSDGTGVSRSLFHGTIQHARQRLAARADNAPCMEFNFEMG